jgi:hypothetical protein
MRQLKDASRRRGPRAISGAKQDKNRLTPLPYLGSKSNFFYSLSHTLGRARDASSLAAETLGDGCFKWQKQKLAKKLVRLMWMQNNSVSIVPIAAAHCQIRGAGSPLRLHSSAPNW